MTAPGLPEINIVFPPKPIEAWRLGLLIAEKGARLIGLLAHAPGEDALSRFLASLKPLDASLVRLEVDCQAPRGLRILVVARSPSSLKEISASMRDAARKAGFRNIEVLDEVSPGLWINTAGFPLIAGSERIIGLRAKQLAEMAGRLKARMGVLAHTLYFHEGRIYGEENARLYRDVVEGGIENHVKAFLAGMQALGRAKVIKVETTREGYVFVLEDAWDYETIECSHTRGVIEGFMSTILGVEFASEARRINKRCIIVLKAGVQH